MKKILLAVIAVVLVAGAGYFVWGKISEPIPWAPALVHGPTPTLSYVSGTKPFVQINFDYTVADKFNIYRSRNEFDNYQKIISDFPASSHTAVDYNFPRDAKILYYRITSIDKNGKESAESTPSSVQITQIDTSNWKTYTNSQYGFEFKYPPAVSVTLVDHPVPHGADLLLPCDGLKITPTEESFCQFGIEKDGTAGNVIDHFFIFPKTMINLESYVYKSITDWPGLQNKDEYSKIDINDGEAYQVHGNNNITRVYIQNLKNLFIFDYSDNNTEAAKTILSTFKFTK